MMIRYIKIDGQKDIYGEFQKFPGLRDRGKRFMECASMVRVDRGYFLQALTCERHRGHKGCHANYAKPYGVLVWDDAGAARREFEYQLTGKFTEKI